MLVRLALVVLLLPYAGWLVLDYEYHLLDGVNLLIHEAGHLVLRPFGMLLHMLGGTLLQLAFPLLFAGRFWWRRERYEAAICGVWAAESLMYTARYLGDARIQALPLVGGHIHDWNWLLARVGLLEHCESIALGLHGLASAGLFASLFAATVFALGRRRASGEIVPG